MKKCMWCGKTMILSTIRKDILCGFCLLEVQKEIEGRSIAIDESFRKMQESTAPETRLINCDIIMEHYTALLKYEIKDIPTINPAPSIFMAEYKSLRDSIIIDGAEEDIKNILAKAWRCADTGLSDKEIDKAWLKVYEVKRSLHDKRKARALERQIADAVKRSRYRDSSTQGYRRGTLDNRSMPQDKGLVSISTN